MSKLRRLVSWIWTKSRSESVVEPMLTQKERASRLRILPLHRVRFIRSDQPKTDSVLVANVSSSGIGFIRSSAVSWPGLGGQVEGTLIIEGQETQIHARVAHISEFIVGCSFDQSPAGFSSVLSHYFAPEITAAKLTEVRAELLQPVSAGTPFCFLGENNCELYFILDGRELRFFSLTFYGNYFEGIPGQPLKFGVVDSEAVSEKAHHKGAQLVRATGKPSKEMAMAAIRFVENIQKAPPEARSNICSILSSQIT